MVEYWNDGIMAIGKMVYWAIGKIHLDMGAGKSNVYSPLKTNPAMVCLKIGHSVPPASPAWL
jgi:hypothetical protein